MNDSDISPGLWATIGIFITGAFAFLIKIIRGSSADSRANFQAIVKRLDAEIKSMQVRIERLENDHANCQSENLALRAQNARHQQEIETLKAQVAALTKP